MEVLRKPRRHRKSWRRRSRCRLHSERDHETSMCVATRMRALLPHEKSVAKMTKRDERQGADSQEKNADRDLICDDREEHTWTRVRGRYGVLHGKRENTEMKKKFKQRWTSLHLIFLMRCSEHPQLVLRCEARSHQSRRVESALHRKSE